MLTDELISDLWNKHVGAGSYMSLQQERFARAVEAKATAELRAERDELRALLTEARVWVCEYDGDDSEFLVRIDAALAKEKS